MDSGNIETGMENVKSGGAFAPLSVPIFRRIWSASLISNFGHLMLGVAAAWEMTRLTDSKEMVALVQSALMLPLMLVSLPAGALADMFDRRRIAMTGLGFSIFSAAMLTALALSGMLTPWLLLLFCVLIGGGVALYNPSWQASISEQVGPDKLPAAIALGTISYNIARSIGPALGGLLIVAAGAQAAFAINTLFYLPLLLAFFFWKKVHIPSRLPPERIDRAIVTGARYAMHSPPVRNILLRAAAFAGAGAAAAGLSPLVARDLLSGNAGSFGLLMGAGGIGAVGGAMLVARVRDHISPELAVRISALTTAASLATIGFSTWLPLSCLAMALSSAANMQSIAMLNVSIQTAVPRWVTARALSLFSAALTGGIAIGAWFWGWVAGEWGVANAFYGSAVAVAFTPLLGLLIPLRRADEAGAEMFPIKSDPDVALALTMRSGPITVEIDYEVDPEAARGFYDVMRRMQDARLRRGAFNWTLSRDIAHPARWTERYKCPTWADYLRQRDRYTQADHELQREADAFHNGTAPKTIRRLLERPFGSVRWKADSPDSGQDLPSYMGP
jgi:predicted MFS family arabinose efflux permease